MSATTRENAKLERSMQESTPEKTNSPVQLASPPERTTLEKPDAKHIVYFHSFSVATVEWKVDGSLQSVTALEDGSD